MNDRRGDVKKWDDDAKIAVIECGGRTYELHLRDFQQFQTLCELLNDAYSQGLSFASERFSDRFLAFLGDISKERPDVLR